MSEINEIVYEGFKSLKLENNLLCLITIPQLGGKIISIVDKDNDLDCIFINKRYPLQENSYGKDYLTSASGFDELFPCIAGAKYPGYPWENTEIPDKGEIWTQSLVTEIKDNNIWQKIHGVRFPYVFNRKISLKENRIKFKYIIENHSPFDFKFLWSTQPHFVFLDETEVKINGHADFFVDYSKDNKFENKKRRFRWPIAEADNGKKIDFSSNYKINGGAEKLFLTDFSSGLISVIYHTKKTKITFEFDNKKIKNCGLWIDRNGWPFEEPDKLIAVGPCNSISDDLNESFSRESFSQVGGYQAFEWDIDMIIENER